MCSGIICATLANNFRSQGMLQPSTCFVRIWEPSVTCQASLCEGSDKGGEVGVALGCLYNCEGSRLHRLHGLQEPPLCRQHDRHFGAAGENP